MIRRLIILLLIVGCGIFEEDDGNAIYSYQLKDLNVYSKTYGEILKHDEFLGKIVLYYFPISDT